MIIDLKVRSDTFLTYLVIVNARTAADIFSSSNLTSARINVSGILGLEACMQPTQRDGCY